MSRSGNRSIILIKLIMNNQKLQISKAGNEQPEITDMPDLEVKNLLNKKNKKDKDYKY